MNEDLIKMVLDWFENHSTEGVKTKFYLKDIVKALSDYDKREVQKAVNKCIEDGSLMWFSTGSTNMLVLPKYHKG